MELVGRVTGSEIVENKDSEHKSVVLQVEFDEPEDVQTVELFNQAGIHTSPVNDARVMSLDLGDSSKISVSVSDNLTPELERGEVDIFSIVDGARDARIQVKIDTQIVLNNGEDWGVQYTALETFCNELQQKHNDLVAEFLAHMHPTAAVGLPSIPTVINPQTPSTADISAAKVDTVRVP